MTNVTLMLVPGKPIAIPVPREDFERLIRRAAVLPSLSASEAQHAY
jgi:hypothetical protein